MIVMDPIRDDWFRNRKIRTAHLMSDLLGEAGTQELIAFAKALGMKESWIQHRGEPKEHFDLMGSKCDAAIRAGAVVNKYRMLNCVRAKQGLPLYDVRED